MTTYYAIRYAYGRDVVNDGQVADTVFAFPDGLSRASFVQSCQFNQPNPNGFNYTEAVYASNPQVRRAKRLGLLKRPSYHPIHKWIVE